MKEEDTEDIFFDANELWLENAAEVLSGVSDEQISNEGFAQVLTDIHTEHFALLSTSAHQTPKG